jgi:hypothetical protein
MKMKHFHIKKIARLYPLILRKAAFFSLTLIWINSYTIYDNPPSSLGERVQSRSSGTALAFFGGRL